MKNILITAFVVFVLFISSITSAQTVVQSGTVAHVYVHTKPSVIHVTEANDVYATVDVYVFDQNCNILPDKMVIVDAECGLFAPDDMGYTDSNGMATFTLYVSDCTVAKTIVIEAWSGCVTGEDTLRFLPGDPCNLEFTSDSYIVNGGDSSSTTTFRIGLKDQFGNSVKDGNSVTFYYNEDDCTCANCEGITIYPSTAYTNNGLATALLTVSAGTNTGTNDCSIDITAEATGVSAICEGQGLHKKSIKITITP